MSGAHTNGGSAQVWTQRRGLPVLRASDVLIVGGSLAGVAAALHYARHGRNVVVVEPRTYLGREVTATLRPWARLPQGAQADSLPESASSLLQAATAAREGELALKLDAVKLCLEDLLLDAGVSLTYASQPIELHAAEGALVIGNKSGRQALLFGTLVDCTETATVARLGGATFEVSPSGPAVYCRTIELDGAPGPVDDWLNVPVTLGIAGDRVRLREGYRGPEHVLVECQLGAPGGFGPEGYARREVEARSRTMAVAEYLLSQVPAFEGAALASSSYELHGPQTGRLIDPVPEWAADTSVRAVAGDTLCGAKLSDFAAPAVNVWCLNESARLSPAGLSALSDPIEACRVGVAFAGTCLGWGGMRPAPRLEEGRIQGEQEAADGPGLEVREPDSPQRGRAYPRFQVGPSSVPVLARTDVLVVGGGTSGATAAITAAREGVDTVLLEMNPGLGGTATLGGVDSYWYGRCVGYSARVSRLTAEVQRSLRYTKPKWNIEAKMHALLREAERVGVRTYLNTATVGAVVEGNRVRGVVCATKWGYFAVLADVVVDATGDGDVAAYAGAEYVYGSERDHTVMWYSLAQFSTPGRTRNNFTSMADVSNIEDYTRAILAGRRRGKDTHDHGVYVAPRESRHIRGRAVMTLTDQLLRRRWCDVVNIHYSNHDVKGPSDSPWVRMGLIPPNLEVEVPYRLMLPEGLEGLLVTGKAVSASHDALPAIRMQADMENLGGVAGLAAAQAVLQERQPGDIEITRLQHRLVEEGLLPAEALDREIQEGEPTLEELTALVDSLPADAPLYAYSDMEMGEIFEGTIPMVQACTAGPAIVPLLERALEGAAGRRRVLLAQALAWHGSPAAVPVLRAEIERALSGGTLPVRDSQIRHAGFPPDQGAMPDLAYLLYALGMTRDRRALPTWERVVQLLEPTDESIRDRRHGAYHYVDAVCYGLEQLGDPGAIPLLQRLRSYPTLRDQVAHQGFQPDYFRERQALLELAIARALARCGSEEGVRLLVSYLGDVRALLAEQAHTTLQAVTGQDHGKDEQAWKRWLELGQHRFQTASWRIENRCGIWEEATNGVSPVYSAAH